MDEHLNDVLGLIGENKDRIDDLYTMEDSISSADNHAPRHDEGGADPLSTVPDHDHTGDAGDGGALALSSVSHLTADYIAFDLDLTGTDYDTDAEMLAVGVKLSDAHSPFPTTVIVVHAGQTWTHSAGNGWQPASTVQNQGPAMLIPLSRPGDWEFEITFDYPATPNNRAGGFYLFSMSGSNHVIAKAQCVDETGGAQRTNSILYSNDGDDTFTSRYNVGSLVVGAGTRTVGLRHKTGTMGMLDPFDAAWHDWSGRQSTGLSFTPAWVGLQFYNHANPATNPTPTMYLENLKLTYLV